MNLSNNQSSAYDFISRHAVAVNIVIGIKLTNSDFSRGNVVINIIRGNDDSIMIILSIDLCTKAPGLITWETEWVK